VKPNTPAFRPQAVNRHVDTDIESGLLRSAPRWTLVLWAALTIALVGAIFFAAVHRVQVHVEGRGLVRPEGGVIVVRAPRAGRIREVRAHDGDATREGAVLVVLGDDDDVVAAQSAGVIDDTTASAGAYVQAGDPLLTIMPDSARLVGFVAFPERDRAALVAGRTMRLRVDAYPYQEHGVGEAKVVRVSPDLVSSKWATQLRAAGIEATGVVLAEVELTTPPPRASSGGFRPGMLFTGEVIVREQRVATLLFRPLAGVLVD